MKNKRKVDGCWSCRHAKMHWIYSYSICACHHDGSLRPSDPDLDETDDDLIYKHQCRQRDWDAEHEVEDYEICDYWEGR